jgi:hypothetical protein
MHPQSPTQLTLSLDPGLTDQHRSLKECLAARVYQQRGGITAVAGRLDMSPSHLSEVLSGGGDRGRKLDLDELERYIQTYHDVTPVLWLVARYLPEAPVQHAAAIERLAELALSLPALLAQIGASGKVPAATKRGR